MEWHKNESICVCCGASVPEGRMVCPLCEADSRETREDTKSASTKCGQSKAVALEKKSYE